MVEEKKSYEPDDDDEWESNELAISLQERERTREHAESHALALRNAIEIADRGDNVGIPTIDYSDISSFTHDKNDQYFFMYLETYKNQVTHDILSTLVKEILVSNTQNISFLKIGTKYNESKYQGLNCNVYHGFSEKGRITPYLNFINMSNHAGVYGIPIIKNGKILEVFYGKPPGYNLPNDTILFDILTTNQQINFIGYMIGELEFRLRDMLFHKKKIGYNVRETVTKNHITIIKNIVSFLNIIINRFFQKMHSNSEILRFLGLVDINILEMIYKDREYTPVLVALLKEIFHSFYFYTDFLQIDEIQKEHEQKTRLIDARIKSLILHGKYALDNIRTIQEFLRENIILQTPIQTPIQTPTTTPTTTPTPTYTPMYIEEEDDDDDWEEREKKKTNKSAFKNSNIKKKTPSRKTNRLKKKTPSRKINRLKKKTPSRKTVLNTR